MEFKKGDMVAVTKNSTSYGGKFVGALGTVKYTFPESNRIGVQLQNFFNSASKTGLYYFCTDELHHLDEVQGIPRAPYLNPFSIKDVIFNDPAVIVLWNDGTKTVVKCSENDIFDPEKGLAMAISKKALGDQGNYYNTFRKYLSVYEEAEEAVSTLLAEIWNNTLGALYKYKKES